MWQDGEDWRVVNSLNKLNEQIRAYAPKSVPPATPTDAWGSIADDAHSSSSDHYPHYYSALGATAVVCARDFPHAPSLGLDGGVVTEHMRQQRDSRIQYIIFNRRITGVNYGWQWHTFTGDNPHDTHFHVSSVHTAAADGAQPFSLPGSTSGADMTPDENLTLKQIHGRVKALLDNATASVQTGTAGVFASEPNKLATAVAGASDAVVIDDVTRQALVDAVNASLTTGLAPILTAWANSPEGRAALVAAANAAEDS